MPNQDIQQMVYVRTAQYFSQRLGAVGDNLAKAGAEPARQDECRRVRQA
jgi:hypothetical protein